jgi:hypothetical protein
MHKTSNVTVYVTEDYKMFTRIKGNRALNTPKIKKMVRDLKHGLNFLPDFPILVSDLNGKLKVIDGQHRLEVAMQMKKPVYYIIRKEEMDLHKIARVNSMQENGHRGTSSTVIWNKALLTTENSVSSWICTAHR